MNTEYIAYSFTCSGKGSLGQIAIQHVEYKEPGEEWSTVKDRLAKRLSTSLSSRGAKVTSIADAFFFYSNEMNLPILEEKYLTQKDVDNLSHWYEDQGTAKNRLGFFPVDD